MQTAFFAISGVLPKEQAIAEIKHAIEKTYGKRGEAVVKMNFDAVDATVENLHEVKVPAAVTATVTRRPPVPAEAPEFVREVLGQIIDADADNIPVSAFPSTAPSAARPSGKAQPASRHPRLGSRFVHPVRQMRDGLPARRSHSPQGVRQGRARQQTRNLQGHGLEVQGIPRDGLHRPGGARGLHGLHAVRGSLPRQGQDPGRTQGAQHGAQLDLRESEAKNWDFFMEIPYLDRKLINPSTIKNSQLCRRSF